VNQHPNRIGLGTAIALVVANIVGAGIFTTTGFQAADLPNPAIIFALWVIGGVLACCGALCFAELGSMMPEAGGEYVYLSRTYGRLFGFMSAFVSLTAGFSAPIAAAIKGFVRYSGHFFPFVFEDRRIGFFELNDVLGLFVLWALVLIHSRGLRGGYKFNDVVTLFKVVGIVVIIAVALSIGGEHWHHLTEVSPRYRELGELDKVTAFATSLIFVMFCYSGWNASAYVAHEIKDPQRNIPRSLMIGTALVILLYFGLNAVFLLGGGVDGIAGQQEVGLVAARELFGPAGTTAVTAVLCVSILASASAMIIAGPRVYYAFGRDFSRVSFLSFRNPETGAPTPALIVQGVVTSIILLSGRLDQIQQYAGFTLSLFSSLAVSCVIVLRLRNPQADRPFRAWGYPVTPVLFLVVSIWTMIWAVRGRPWESVLALVTVIVGGLAFYVVERRGEDP